MSYNSNSIWQFNETLHLLWRLIRSRHIYCTPYSFRYKVFWFTEGHIHVTPCTVTTNKSQLIAWYLSIYCCLLWQSKMCIRTEIKYWTFNREWWHLWILNESKMISSILNAIPLFIYRSDHLGLFWRCSVWRMTR